MGQCRHISQEKRSSVLVSHANAKLTELRLINHRVASSLHFKAVLCLQTTVKPVNCVSGSQYNNALLQQRSKVTRGITSTLPENKALPHSYG